MATILILLLVCAVMTNADQFLWTSPGDNAFVEVKEGEDISLLWEYQADSSSSMVLIETEDVVIGQWFERQNNFTIYPVFQGRVIFGRTVSKQDDSGFYGEKIELKLMKAKRNDLNVSYTCELILKNSIVKQKDIRVGYPADQFLWTSPGDNAFVEVQEGEDISLLWEYQADSLSSMVLIKTEDVVIGQWFERQNNFTIYPVFQGRVIFERTVIKQDDPGFYGEKIELKLMKANRNDLNVPYTCELILKNSIIKQKDIRVGWPDSSDTPMHDTARPNSHLFRILPAVVIVVVFILVLFGVAVACFLRRRRTDGSRFFRLNEEHVTTTYNNNKEDGSVYLPVVKKETW